MEALKVNSICRYKERRHVEHEYLIAEISDPDSAQPRYLQIERTVQDPQASKTQDTTTEKLSPLRIHPFFSILTRSLEKAPCTRYCLDKGRMAYYY